MNLPFDNDTRAIVQKLTKRNQKADFNSIDPVEVARGVFQYGRVRIELGDYGSQFHNSEQFVELQRDNLLSSEYGLCHWIHYLCLCPLRI